MARASMVAPLRPPDERPQPLDAAVLVVAEQHLVVRPSASERTTAFSAVRRVGCEGEVPGSAPTYAARARRASSSRAEPAFEREELDRLALELELPGLVPLEDRPWASAERAVVQEDDVRVEQERFLHSP